MITNNSTLAKLTINAFPQNIETFIDGCAGGGVITMSLPQELHDRFKRIILNDFDKAIANFYRVLKGEQGDELIKQLLKLKCNDCIRFEDAIRFQKMGYPNMSDFAKAVNFT